MAIVVDRNGKEISPEGGERCLYAPGDGVGRTGVTRCIQSTNEVVVIPDTPGPDVIITADYSFRRRQYTTAGGALRLTWLEIMH